MLMLFESAETRIFIPGLSCIRLVQLEFELTDQDSEGGKNCTVLKSCMLIGKALHLGNFSLWRRHYELL